MHPEDALRDFFDSITELIDIQRKLTPHLTWLLQHDTPTPGLKKIIFLLFHHIRRVHRRIFTFSEEYNEFRGIAVQVNEHDVVDHLDTVYAALMDTGRNNELMRVKVRELLIDRWGAFGTVCNGGKADECFCREIDRGDGDLEMCVCSWFEGVGRGESDSESFMSSDDSSSSNSPSSPLLGSDGDGERYLIESDIYSREDAEKYGVAAESRSTFLKNMLFFLLPVFVVVVFGW